MTQAQIARIHTEVGDEKEKKATGQTGSLPEQSKKTILGEYARTNSKKNIMKHKTLTGTGKNAKIRRPAIFSRSHKPQQDNRSKQTNNSSPFDGWMDGWDCRVLVACWMRSSTGRRSHR